jgi:hypothetical protein
VVLLRAQLYVLGCVLLGCRPAAAGAVWFDVLGCLGIPQLGHQMAQPLLLLLLLLLGASCGWCHNRERWAVRAHEV